MTTGKINWTHVDILKQLSAPLMETTVTVPTSYPFYLGQLCYRSKSFGWGLSLLANITQPSELLPLESSVSDEELDGELLDNWARSSCWRFTPLSRAGVTMVGDVAVIRLLEVFLFCWVFSWENLKMFPSQKNWTCSFVHPLAGWDLSLAAFLS